MKTLKLFLSAAAIGILSFSSMLSAQESGLRGDRSHNDGEFEFTIGDTTIRIGDNERYNGRNHQSLERRIYQLERAVRFLLEDAKYNMVRDKWECSLSPVQSEFYSARSDTEASATAKVVKVCRENSKYYYNFCMAKSVSCEELR